MSLKYFGAGWFLPVLALAVAAHAWMGGVPVFGDMAVGVGLVLGVLAVAAAVTVAAGWVVRLRLNARDCEAEWRNTWRFGLFSAGPMALLVIAALLAAAGGWIRTVATVLWWPAAAAQFGLLVAQLQRWLVHGQKSALKSVVLPPLFLLAAGQMLAPLAGVELAGPRIAAAQWGAGLLFAPIFLAVFVAQQLEHGPIAQRHLPLVFLTAAPPLAGALGGAALQLPAAWLWAFWGMALVLLLACLPLWRQLRMQPFALTHWAVGFVLAAFADLTLRLNDGLVGVLPQVGVALLALASLVIVGLGLGTWRGLRDGTLLGPEPVALIGTQ